MHQPCAPLHNPKISSKRNWMLLFNWQHSQTEQLYILGDFNPRVGADHESWTTCLGHHGMEKMNENGQRLIELWCHHGLSITNTFFENKPCHKVSWRHRRSGHWHQLDIVITIRDALNNVLNTSSYHSADCDTDPCWYAPGSECNQNCFFIPSRKAIYVLTSVTLPIPRRINSSFNQSERRSSELKQKCRRELQHSSWHYTTQH